MSAPSASPGAPGPAPASGPATPVSARVLIAEDDPLQAKLVASLAATVGCAVIGVVPDGRTAVTRAGEADLLVLDYQLEGDVDGIAVLREVKSLALAAKVVITTAHGSERVAAEALRLGADDYLIKGDGFMELLPRVLGRVLKLRAIEAQLAEAQAQVVIAQRKAAIGEIVVAISHEMNNPLMAVRAELELMKLDAAALPDRARAGVISAIAQLDRISAVLRKLATHSSDATVTYIGGTRMTDLGR